MEAEAVSMAVADLAVSTEGVGVLGLLVQGLEWVEGALDFRARALALTLDPANGTRFETRPAMRVRCRHPTSATPPGQDRMGPTLSAAGAKRSAAHTSSEIQETTQLQRVREPRLPRALPLWDQRPRGVLRAQGMTFARQLQRAPQLQSYRMLMY